MPDERSKRPRRVGWPGRPENSKSSGGGERLRGVVQQRPGFSRGVQEDNEANYEREVSFWRLSSCARRGGTGKRDGAGGRGRVSRPLALQQEGSRSDEGTTRRAKRPATRPRRWVPQDGFEASQWMVQQPDPTTEEPANDDDAPSSHSIAFDGLGSRHGGDGGGGGHGVGGVSGSRHSTLQNEEEDGENEHAVDGSERISSRSSGCARGQRGTPAQELSRPMSQGAASSVRAQGEAARRIGEAADAGDDQDHNPAETLHAAGLTEEAFEGPGDEVRGNTCITE